MSALDAWRKKLDFLLEQEAIAADAGQKFAIQTQIAEARQKLRELEPAGQTSPSRRLHLDQLPTVAGQFFGRAAELSLLDQALDTGEPRIVEFVAPGGVGKTKLLRHWLDRREGDIPALIAWSFYSQGSHEDKQVSSSPFFGAAFRLLGSEQTQFPSEDAKGRHLAELLKAQRCLLVLDGLEPMQYAGRGMRGELKDKALLALLKSLLAGGAGPCLISTRLRLPELQDRPHAHSQDLHNLPAGDGVKLLRSLGVRGSEAALKQAVQDYGCHALALHLLGNTLRVFCEGDIQRRERLPELIEPEQYANDSRESLHAFKVMQAYQDWLKDEQGRELPELRLLYLLGLFDHPVDRAVLETLWSEAIVGLTVENPPQSPFGKGGRQEASPAEGQALSAGADPPLPARAAGTSPLPARAAEISPLWQRGAGGDSSGSQAELGNQENQGKENQESQGKATLTARQWQTAIAALRDDHHLLTCHDTQTGLLDCHPLIREFFGRRLERQNPDAFQQAHRLLYDYYKAQPKQERPDTLEDLRPLFHAVAHGCAAGLHQQALDEVYWPRIKRKNEHYLTKKLGAFGDDLASVAHFFAQPWRTPAAGLTEHWQACVLNWAGFCLRALGRLREAVEPMQKNLQGDVSKSRWKFAAQAASNLSELQLALGEFATAIASARLGVGYADKTEDKFQQMSKRATLADALHQAGDRAAAQELLEEAERLQGEFQPQYPRLYSLRGFRYCDLLLAQGETAAVLERAGEALEIAKQHLGLLSIALDQLCLGRAYLLVGAGHARDTRDDPAQWQESPQADQDHPAGTAGGTGRGHGPLLQQARHWLELALAGLRAAGDQDMLPLGLLAHAEYCRQAQDFAAAREDLQEVWDLAEPAGMLLHLTDYHLESARLDLAEAPVGRNKPVPALAGTGVSGITPAAAGNAPPSLRSEGLIPAYIDTARQHSEAAAQLIQQTGYKRRLPELQALQQDLAAMC